MLDPQLMDQLFDSLIRFVRIRERAVHTTFRTSEGEVETAAFKALFPLSRNPMRSRELAAELTADPSTVSRHVAALVDLGLVRREADPADGRATLLVITDAGRARVEAMRSIRREAMDRAMGDWTDGELATLVTLLTRFVDAAETFLVPDCGRPDSPGTTAPPASKGSR
ncbi:MarR family transcriptional regulator [Gordonia desulfuricans]|uniref:MarR family transcriptional regulator n=1 Tax=Gordonia desulfuricans TaxID=89051 RepID=A0A7K3LIY0_9ACTN|nr:MULTISPECIES: MarR family transcriptional regulator [Gordonia]EMP14277.1 MarR family transcriptional regulator [Gordonia sp. NB41Y]NDK88133.1 MarR family transcriptional regulator [Gordonia desulfuricans]WLP89190.1 MarR family transcriptional regulator [Gordonia sp. NB41Y]